MSTALAITAIVLALIAVAGQFTALRWSPIAAYAALWPAWISLARGLGGSAGTLVFWGCAAAIAIAINVMLPKGVATSHQGNGYIVLGAVIGALVGLVIMPTWLVLGAVIGAILGALAYVRTPAGRHLEFPSSRFIAYLCAKGLPAVVTVAMAAIAVFRAVAAFRVL